MKNFLFNLILCAISTVGYINANPTVKLSNGELEGLVGVSRGGREFNKFLGIPYGKVAKRFGISESADAWSGVKKAVDSGEGCIAYPLLGGSVSGTEDCLTLDVYSPLNLNSSGNSTESSTPTTLLPVMVWIYGGGFIAGSTNSYDGNFFMDQNVVLVLPNYRLGPIGFLNAGVSEARGNQGLKDMVLALRWVQDNIVHFGGDKGVVTIFGESAGSVSVALLLTSPMTRDGGLFHRAIMQSGTSLMPSIYRTESGLDLAKKLGQALDCPTSNPQYLVECLGRMDPKILGGFGNFMNEFGYDENAVLIGPSYETYEERENDTSIFMTEDPYITAKEGKISKIPVIMGLMHTESSWSALPVISNSTTLKRLNGQWSRILPSILIMGKVAEDPGVVSEQIKQHFFDGMELSNGTKSMEQLEHLLDERHWIHPLRILATQLSKHNGGNVYLYNFTKPAQSLPPPYGSGKQRKASHADDVKFFFGIRGPFAAFMPTINKDHHDYNLSKHLVEMWAAFAKDGKPKPLWGSADTEEEGLTWPTAFNKNDTDSHHGHPTFLYIDDKPNVEKVGEWYETYGRFWDGLNLKEYGKVWASEN